MKTIFVLLFPLFIWCQESKSGSIIYKYKMNRSFLTEVKELSSKLEEDSRNITFTLDFEKNLTLFSLNENLNTSRNLAVSFTKARKPILSDLYKRKYYQSTPHSVLFLENEFTIEYDFLKWSLTDESKIIENKTVFKAEGDVTVLINNEVVNQKIIAWYCPEIPISIGPRGVNGLPGLIYVLEDRYGAFIIENIKLTEKQLIKPKNLLDNEIISESDFYQLSIERKKIFDKAIESKN